MFNERVENLKQAGKKLALVALTAAMMSACSSDSNNDPVKEVDLGNSGDPSTGDANFTSYVAIGDSLTAGYMDGTLYLFGQLNSMPGILSQQASQAAGQQLAFTQPLLGDPTDDASRAAANLGGLLNAGDIIDFGTGVNQFDTRFVLNTETETPERVAGPPVSDATNVVAGPYSNMGVPGLKSFHLNLNFMGNAALIGDPGTPSNPWFVRMASAADTTVLGDAVAQTPSFVTVWVGGNDVLLYASSGGWDDYANAPASTSGFGAFDITPEVTFDANYEGIIAQLKGVNADVQGVLVNVPAITSIPFFSVVPYNAVPMTAEQAEQANAGFQAYNDGLDAVVGMVPGFTQEEADMRKIVFAEGQNALVIFDEDLTDLTVANAALVNMRQATADDLIMFDTAAKLGTAAVEGDPTTLWGVGAPLLDQDVLIPSEIEAVETATAAYNQTIADIAAAEPNFVLFDAAAELAELKANGIDYGSRPLTADYVTGGFFSLDGIHPTARGYAYIADRIIDTINEGFNANIYKVDPGAYPGIFLN